VVTGDEELTHPSCRLVSRRLDVGGDKPHSRRQQWTGAVTAPAGRALRPSDEELGVRITHNRASPRLMGLAARVTRGRCLMPATRAATDLPSRESPKESGLAAMGAR
jgi:hypothetical protein